MANRILTAEERRLLKERVSEARRAREADRPRRVSFAEHCLDATKGDPWLALDLAVEMTRNQFDPEAVHPKAELNRSLQRRLSYQELFAHA